MTTLPPRSITSATVILMQAADEAEPHELTFGALIADNEFVDAEAEEVALALCSIGEYRAGAAPAWRVWLPDVTPVTMPRRGSDTTVARTILVQLGGSRFLAMTGARNLIADDRALSFHLPRGLSSQRIDRVSIVLDPSDTYTVRFGRWHSRRLEIDWLTEHSGVYADHLRTTFTASTGLATSL